MGSDPYFVGLAAYLTSTIPRITRAFELMFEWYGKNSAAARSVNVESIRPHRNERRSPIVTSDTTGSTVTVVPTSSDTVTVEECESIEACFSSSYLL